MLVYLMVGDHLEGVNVAVSIENKPVRLPVSASTQYLFAFTISFSDHFSPTGPLANTCLYT